jgi:hypothetical protein
MSFVLPGGSLVRFALDDAIAESIAAASVCGSLNSVSIAIDTCRPETFEMCRVLASSATTCAPKISTG